MHNMKKLLHQKHHQREEITLLL